MFLFNWVTSVANTPIEDVHANVPTAPKITSNMKEHFETDALVSDYTHDSVILADTIDDLQKRVKDLEVTVASLIRKIQLPTSTIVEQEKIPVTPTGSPVDVPTFTNTVILADEKNMAKPKKINGIMLDAFQAELTSKLEKIRCNMGASQNMSR